MTTERCLWNEALPESLLFKKDVTLLLLGPAFSLFTKLVTLLAALLLPPQLLALDGTKEVTVRDLMMFPEPAAAGRDITIGVAPADLSLEGVFAVDLLITMLKGLAAGLALCAEWRGLNGATAGVGATVWLMALSMAIVMRTPIFLSCSQITKPTH
jgi:hypothetical protein